MTEAPTCDREPTSSRCWAEPKRKSASASAVAAPFSRATQPVQTGADSTSATSHTSAIIAALFWRVTMIV